MHIGVAAGLSIAVASATPVYGQTTDGGHGFTNSRIGIGGGTTFQYDFNGTHPSPIAELNWTLPGDFVEIAAFRFFEAQQFEHIPLANPNWAFAVSGRWTFLNRPVNRLFVGLGGAYKTEVDQINGSRLNFTEQLGWRFISSPTGPGFEVTLRHMSNAGLKQPNRGQDFLTLAYLF